MRESEGGVNESIRKFATIISEKACPHCKKLLDWSQHEEPPNVDFNTKTGHVRSVEIMRFCLNCGYREVGFVTIGKDPL